MLSEDEKKRLQHRIRRIVGQVQAVGRMIDENEPFAEVVMQVRAANGALEKVSELLLRQHLESTLAKPLDALAPEQRDALMKELVALFEKYAQTK